MGKTGSSSGRQDRAQENSDRLHFLGLQITVTGD